MKFTTDYENAEKERVEAHKQAIHAKIDEAMTLLFDEYGDWSSFAQAIADGKIPHVKIVY